MSKASSYTELLLKEINTLAVRTIETNPTAEKYQVDLLPAIIPILPARVTRFWDVSHLRKDNAALLVNYKVLTGSALAELARLGRADRRIIVKELQIVLKRLERAMRAYIKLAKQFIKEGGLTRFDFELNLGPMFPGAFVGPASITNVFIIDLGAVLEYKYDILKEFLQNVTAQSKTIKI